VVRAGKVRYLGASSMHAWQFMKALGLQRARGWAAFVSMQNYYNLLYREDEREMLGLCVSEGVGVTPWSPLARGKLARPWAADPTTERAKTDAFGKTLFDKTVDIDKPVIDRTNEIARERAVSPAQVAMAWLLSRPGVTSPVVGATRPQHLEDAVAAIGLTLSTDEIARLEETYQPHPATEGYS
jgi:aryl-alcohol dehydrogenase-like predicted oxidoreductase